jgi:hypothetical protein
VITRAKETFERHKRWMPIAFFVIGFIFDALMLQRIDEFFTIAQQAVYLMISAILIRVEFIESQREIKVPTWLKKPWHYREDVLHFLMGTLLNAYTLFFFKSASAITSFAFIVLLVILLILNEFGRFGKSQTQVHVALLSLCLIAYLVTLVPIVLGFIGLIPFLLANLCTIAVFWLYRNWVRPVLATDPKMLRTHLEYPFMGIIGVFALLYFLHMIPPVPLSVQYMGIYHDVQKTDAGDYQLTYTRPDSYFWQHGDQTFIARPGDAIFCFARVFSPARFKDQLQVRWLFKDPKNGWQTSDTIGFQIVGGREEGFRGVTRKGNFQPGTWRVQIETKDGHEVGRLGFTVENDTTEAERQTKTTIE